MSEQKILATVDGVTITDADVDGFIASLSPEQQRHAANPQFRKQCLDRLTSLILLSKMAKEEKLDETEEFQILLEGAKRDILAQMAVDNLIKNIEVTEEEAKSFYEQNAHHFKKGESVSAKHILVPDEDKCLEILAAINNGEKEFEDAAREFSTCPSKEQGGDLGEFGRGQMVPEFDQAAFDAEVGAVVGPVQTQFGYHLIKVEKKTEASISPFEEVGERIRMNLLQRKQSEVYAAKVEELREKYLGE